MQRCSRHIFSGILFVLVASALIAGGPYLGKNAPDALQLLPAPPAAGSAEDVADREAARRIYEARTPEQFALGQAQQHLNVFHLTTMLPWFQPGKFPKAEALFKQMEQESYAITGGAKKVWMRPRPHQADPDKFPQVIEQDKKPSSGYPSGHATRATMHAVVLAELFPEQREAILVKAQESSWLRILGGVHTPLDIEAGKKLGQAIAQAFLRSEEFQKDLAEVKAEIAAGRPQVSESRTNAN